MHLFPYGYSISLSLAREFSGTKSTIFRKSHSTHTYFSRLSSAKWERQGYTLIFFPHCFTLIPLITSKEKNKEQIPIIQCFDIKLLDTSEAVINSKLISCAANSCNSINMGPRKSCSKLKLRNFCSLKSCFLYKWNVVFLMPVCMKSKSRLLFSTDLQIGTYFTHLTRSLRSEYLVWETPNKYRNFSK